MIRLKNKAYGHWILSLGVKWLNWDCLGLVQGSDHSKPEPNLAEPEPEVRFKVQPKCWTEPKVRFRVRENSERTRPNRTCPSLVKTSRSNANERGIVSSVIVFVVGRDIMGTIRWSNEYLFLTAAYCLLLGSQGLGLRLGTTKNFWIGTASHGGPSQLHDIHGTGTNSAYRSFGLIPWPISFYFMETSSLVASPLISHWVSWLTLELTNDLVIIGLLRLLSAKWPSRFLLVRTFIIFTFFYLVMSLRIFKHSQEELSNFRFSWCWEQWYKHSPITM